MATVNQNIRGARKEKRKRLSKCASIFGKKIPQMSGRVKSVSTRTPKKPNSALRKVCNVELSNGRVVTAYIPGIGHEINENAVVLLKGGGPADLPGVNISVIRRSADGAGAVKGYSNARSLYGVKKPKKEKK